MTRRQIGVSLVVALLVLACWLLLTPSGHYAQFVIGGGLVNLGYRMQDHLRNYDFEHQDLSPEDVWREMLRQNRMASAAGEQTPRRGRPCESVQLARTPSATGASPPSSPARTSEGSQSAIEGMATSRITATM